MITQEHLVVYTIVFRRAKQTRGAGYLVKAITDAPKRRRGRHIPYDYSSINPQLSALAVYLGVDEGWLGPRVNMARSTHGDGLVAVMCKRDVIESFRHR